MLTGIEEEAVEETRRALIEPSVESCKKADTLG